MTITLQSLTKEIPDNHIAFIFPECEHVTYGLLRDKVGSYQETLNIIKGKRVVIYGRSRKEFALLLYFLDGVAEEVLFLPTDIDDRLFQMYVQQSLTEYSVTYDNVSGMNLTKISSGDSKFYDVVDREVSQTKWIVPTSGTTNTPKLVAHQLDGLTRTIKSDFEIGKNYVWGLVYDIYRFAGIQVYLQALVGGSTLAIPDSEMSMDSMLSFFASSNCNTLSATPSFWRKALMSSSIKNLKLINITLGGEIVDSQILRSLKYQFPGSKIRHIYASTEAGVGFSVIDEKEGFPISYLKSDESGAKLKINNSGVLLIKPTYISQKYVSGNSICDENGYVNTGDLVEIKEDRVVFLGRESGAINVGGSKVQPEEVENCILEMNLVSQVKVYAKSSSMLGSLVCADIVLKDTTLDPKLSMEIIQLFEDLSAINHNKFLVFICSKKQISIATIF